MAALANPFEPQSLLVSNPAPVATFTLAGASTPACNGIYTVVGQYEWANLYKHQTEPYWVRYFPDENWWVVTDEVYYGSDEYFRRAASQPFGAYTNVVGTGSVTFTEN